MSVCGVSPLPRRRFCPSFPPSPPSRLPLPAPSVPGLRSCGFLKLNVIFTVPAGVCNVSDKWSSSRRFQVMQGKGQSWGGSWAGFPSALHGQARGVWLMSAADKGDERIIKRPQSPFIFLPVFPPLISFIVAVLSVCSFPPFRRGREHQGPG